MEMTDVQHYSLCLNNKKKNFIPRSEGETHQTVIVASNCVQTENGTINDKDVQQVN